MARALKRTALLIGLLLAVACGNGPANLTELDRARAERLELVLLSSREVIHHGTDEFVVEFRSAQDGGLVDVGTVKGAASMPMGGTPMMGRIDVTRTNVPGRYGVKSDLSMAGTWRMTFEWSGTAAGAVTLSRSVQ